MRERIRKLRKQSVAAKPYISPERAILITEFYESETANQASIPMRRALAFKHVLENKKICINDGELIVGERGSAPKETSTYPEICCHMLRDLEILNLSAKRLNRETEDVLKFQVEP